VLQHASIVRDRAFISYFRNVQDPSTGRWSVLVPFWSPMITIFGDLGTPRIKSSYSNQPGFINPGLTLPMILMYPSCNMRVGVTLPTRSSTIQPYLLRKWFGYDLRFIAIFQKLFRSLLSICFGLTLKHCLKMLETCLGSIVGLFWVAPENDVIKTSSRKHWMCYCLKLAIARFIRWTKSP